MCVTVLPFSLWSSLLKSFCFVIQGFVILETYSDFTLSCPLFPCVSVSVSRFATTQTAKTWIPKAPFTCVSHVTHAAIQRTQTTCTLIGTPDLTYNLKVDFQCLFVMMSYPASHQWISRCDPSVYCVYKETFSSPIFFLWKKSLNCCDYSIYV